MKASHSSNLDILGAHIGYYIHCAKLIASKQVEALKLLSKLHNVAIIDPKWFSTYFVCVVVFVDSPKHHPSLSLHWIMHAPHQGYCVWCRRCLIPEEDLGRGSSIFVWVPGFSMKCVVTARGCNLTLDSASRWNVQPGTAFSSFSP